MVSRAIQPVEVALPEYVKRLPNRHYTSHSAMGRLVCCQPVHWSGFAALRCEVCVTRLGNNRADIRTDAVLPDYGLADSRGSCPIHDRAAGLDKLH